jgi:hypothetical protein
MYDGTRPSPTHRSPGHRPHPPGSSCSTDRKPAGRSLVLGLNRYEPPERRGITSAATGGQPAPCFSSFPALLSKSRRSRHPGGVSGDISPCLFPCDSPCDLPHLFGCDFGIDSPCDSPWLCPCDFPCDSPLDSPWLFRCNEDCDSPLVFPCDNPCDFPCPSPFDSGCHNPADLPLYSDLCPRPGRYARCPQALQGRTLISESGNRGASEPNTTRLQKLSKAGPKRKLTSAPRAWVNSI